MEKYKPGKKKPTNPEWRRKCSKKFIGRGWAYRDKKNGQVGQHKTATKVAAALEMSTH